MKRPYSTAVYNTATQEARICYVRAWDDPRWREAMGLPPKQKRRVVPSDRDVVSEERP